MKRLVPALGLILLAASCDPDRPRPTRFPTPGSSPTPTPVVQQTPGSNPTPTPMIAGESPFYVTNGQEIWMKPAAPGGRPRRVFRTDEHEGLGELAPSPDRHWIVSRIAFMYDVPESPDFRTYLVLVHVDTATRLDMQELPARLGLSGQAADLAWVPGKLATLKVTMADTTSQQVDLPASGPPQ